MRTVNSVHRMTCGTGSALSSRADSDLVTASVIVTVFDALDSSVRCELPLQGFRAYRDSQIMWCRRARKEAFLLQPPDLLVFLFGHVF